MNATSSFIGTRSGPGAFRSLTAFAIIASLLVTSAGCRYWSTISFEKLGNCKFRGRFIRITDDIGKRDTIYVTEYSYPFVTGRNMRRLPFRGDLTRYAKVELLKRSRIWLLPAIVLGAPVFCLLYYVIFLILFGPGDRW